MCSREIHEDLRGGCHHGHGSGEDALHQTIPITNAAGRTGALVGVRRAGDEQVRLFASHQRADHGSVGGVTADQAVRAESPHIAGARDGIGRHLGHVIGFVLAALRLILSRMIIDQQGVDLGGVESRQNEVELGQLQVFEFQRQQGVIPTRPGRRTVGEQAECLDLGIGQFIGQHHGNRAQAQSARRLEPEMTIDNLPAAPGDHRNPETEFGDDDGHLLDSVIVLARIAGVVDQSIDRPLLQLEFGWGQV